MDLTSAYSYRGISTLEDRSEENIQFENWKKKKVENIEKNIRNSRRSGGKSLLGESLKEKGKRMDLNHI